MRFKPVSRVVLPGIAILAAATSFSCVDEEIVFRDRELFEQPPTAAQGMLGYTDMETKLTVCGNCHVGQQNDWETTAHADAWAGLQDSGHSQSFCEGCHTISELGNEIDEPAGWTAVNDPRYQDVQCESCHGPGLAHVNNPDASQPLAPADVGLDLTFGCGECHQGTHHPFVEEWEQSGHGGVIGFAAARDGCKSCHEGKGAMVAFGVNAEFVEKGSSESMAITCSVCHDPHDARNEGQLRFPINVADVEQHMCAQCHDRRSTPNPASSHGLEPHSPETGLLQGDVGWFPPGINIDRGEIIATHGSEANPGLCTTCHVSSFTVTDEETGEFQFDATGHTFAAIPCLDAEGIPTTGDCDLSTDARQFEGCTGAGCHGTPQTAFSALASATTRLENLADELRDLLLQVDGNLGEPGGVIDATNPEFNSAEGAFFNYALAAFGGEDRADPRLTFAAAASHNPFLVEQLLLGSIEAVEEEFGVQASNDLVRTRLLVGHGTR